MMKSQLKISLLAAFSFLILLTSCSKEEINVSDFTDETLLLVETETRSGKSGCYELVFPVTIDFPDGTSAEVDELESLKSSVKEWKENNQDVEGRPHLAFPYDILTEDGNLITVENKLQRRALRIKCKVSSVNGPNGHLGKPCFRLVYPISVIFPNEETIEVGSRKELKIALRKWRAENPDAEGRPSLSYPVDVIFEDQSIHTVSSKEELKQLKKECRE